MGDRHRSLVGVAPHVDEATEWANTFRKIHGDDAANKFLKNGITESDLNVIAKNRGNLLRTMAVVKRADGKVVWLEEGLTEAEAMALGVKPSGWKHLKEGRDIIVQGERNQFSDIFGATYKDEDKIRELIMKGAKDGHDISTPLHKGLHEYREPVTGNILHLVIGENGYIVTAMPIKVNP